MPQAWDRRECRATTLRLMFLTLQCRGAGEVAWLVAMLDFVFRPLRSVLGIAEHEVAAPLEDAEREIVDAASAIERASESIEHHVEVIEGLATSIAPLTDSVNRMNTTLAELVVLLAPLQKAAHEADRVEHEADRVEHFFGLRRHRKPTPESEAPEAEQPK